MLEIWRLFFKPFNTPDDLLPDNERSLVWHMTLHRQGQKCYMTWGQKSLLLKSEGQCLPMGRSDQISSRLTRWLPHGPPIIQYAQQIKANSSRIRIAYVWAKTGEYLDWANVGNRSRNYLNKFQLDFSLAEFEVRFAVFRFPKFVVIPLIN